MASPAGSAPTIVESLHVAPADWGSYVVRCLASGERLFDGTAVMAAIYLAEVFHLKFGERPPPWQTPSARFFSAAGFALLFVFLLERHGGYRPCLSLLGIRETERVMRVTLQAFLIALVTASLLRITVSRISIAVALMLSPLFLVVEKWELQKLLRTLRGKGYGTRRAVIVGTRSTARRLYTALITSPKLGIEPVAFVEEGAPAESTEIYECWYRRKHPAKVVPGPLTSELLRQLQVSVLVVADPALDRETMLLTMSEASQRGVQTYFAAEEFLDAGRRMDYAEIDGIMLAHPCEDSPRVLYDLGKRTLDLVIAGLVLVLSAPFAAAIALVITRTSPGPVLFRQQRVGKAGRLFTMYKFRTMYQDAPHYGYSPKQEGDPRITPVGRFLRRTSLDEIPQFLNVLLGHMSLVGPRPEMPFIVEQYTHAQRERLKVKPGITGLWQISADRAYVIHENLEYDLYYALNNPRFVWQIALQFAGIRKFRLEES
jgi:exopolysaccharide biosynthesis polyprenyl glycosylphosphotransferase